MKRRSTRVPVAKQQRRRTPKPKLPADSAGQPDVGPSVGTPYETNVAPDLIDEGRSPVRSEVLDSECSLPAKNGVGAPD